MQIVEYAGLGDEAAKRTISMPGPVCMEPSCHHNLDCQHVSRVMRMLV